MDCYKYLLQCLLMLFYRKRIYYQNINGFAFFNLYKMKESILDERNTKTLNRTKIGYIKINSTRGQITFVANDIGGGILYNRPNVHRGNVKQKNVIHMNVKPDLFIDYATQIKQHMRMLIKMFLDLDIDDFKLIMHKFK